MCVDVVESPPELYTGESLSPQSIIHILNTEGRTLTGRQQFFTRLIPPHTRKENVLLGNVSAPTVMRALCSATATLCSFTTECLIRQVNLNCMKVLRPSAHLNVFSISRTTNSWGRHDQESPASRAAQISSTTQTALPKEMTWNY